MYDKEIKIKRILEQAKKIMPDFDTVIDIFTMCFVFISEKSAKLSGYTPKEMIGKHISNFMTTNSKSEEFRKVIMSTMSGKAVIPIKTKTGKELSIQMDFITIQVGNNPFLVTKATKS